MTPRRPYPQFNEFRPFIYDELKRRKLTYPTPIITPFVRLTSTMVDATSGLRYRNLSLGLHGFDNRSINMFDLTYGGLNTGVVGTAYDLNAPDANNQSAKKIITSDMISVDYGTFAQSDPSLIREQGDARLSEARRTVPRVPHPAPGITNVSVTRRGLGEPLTAQVQWQCYNRGQLEFLRTHFLIPGNHVILEFGQLFSDERQIKTLNFANYQQLSNELLRVVGAIHRTPGLADQTGRAYVIENYNKPNQGNYDFIVGQIGNFQIEFEPATNIYKCTTTIVSQGENMWGVSLDNTHFNQINENSGITSIREYFTSGMFDRFIQTHVRDGNENVYHFINSAFEKQLNANRRRESSTETSEDDVTQNPMDYTYVSWKFLFRELFQDMIGVISDEFVRKQLTDFLQFYNVEDDEYVGFHPTLRSTDPETMLLITNWVEPYAIELKFPRIGKFGGYYSSNRQGKLTEGVWVMAGAIRESFMNSMDLRQSITTLLNKMNYAVGNYWQLQLFYDEENARYKIIDYKFGDQARGRSFYKFNVGGAGECLSVEFDSAFPPELITQMMLSAKFKASSAEEQQKLLKTMPLLGTTSAHMFVLNWTNLVDDLQTAIRAHQNGTAPLPTNSIVVLEPADSLNPTTAARVAGTTPVGPQLTEVGVDRQPGDALGASRLSLAPAASTFVQLESPSTQNTIVVGTLPVDRTDTDFNKLIPAFRSQVKSVIDILQSEGYTIQIVEAFRSQERQTYLYGQGRERDGKIVTWTTDSAHTRGAAVDLNVYKNKPYDGNLRMRELIRSRQSEWPLLELLPDEYNDIGHIQQLGYAGLPKLTSVDGNVSTAETSLARTPNSDQQTSFTDQQAEERRRAEVSAKFGDGIVRLIATSRNKMINSITNDAYKDVSQVNSFMSPFPTSTSVTVEIQGIAGISISDGFFVDKIPFVFEKHGVFQVTEITDTVTASGWKTRIRGYFKMLWYDGNGNTSPRF